MNVDPKQINNLIKIFCELDEEYRGKALMEDAPHTIEIKTKGLLIHLSNSVHPALLRTLIESLKESLG